APLPLAQPQPIAGCAPATSAVARQLTVGTAVARAGRAPLARTRRERKSGRAAEDRDGRGVIGASSRRAYGVDRNGAPQLECPPGPRRETRTGLTRPPSSHTTGTHSSTPGQRRGRAGPPGSARRLR